MKKLRILIVAMMLSFPTVTSIAAAQQAATPTACSATQFHQLDYWIGDWDVFDTAKGYKVGTSRIASVVNGCAIQESYDAPEAPGGAYAGNSYSAFEPKDGKWHQYYVDTTGSTTWFTGELEGTAISLIAAGKKPGVTIRMKYIPEANGSVRQVGHSSIDGGKNWQPNYDYTYRRKAGSSAIR